MTYSTYVVFAMQAPLVDLCGPAPYQHRSRLLPRCQRLPHRIAHHHDLFVTLLVVLGAPVDRPGLEVDIVPDQVPPRREDRKSTRLNSSHVKISYAVFCLKKKKKHSKTSSSYTKNKTSLNT